MSRRTVEQWRREVFRSPVSANVRLLLIYMADHMRERDKHVSIPRAQMAKALGWTETRVSERLREAVDHGFLDSKSPGYRGHTAEYQGVWPDVPIAKSVRKNSTHSRDQKTGRFDGGKRPGNTDTTSRADLPESTTDRNEGSSEEACRFHPWSSCPADCADHPATRRRTA